MLSPSSLLGTAAAISAAVCVAVLATGGTYALLNSTTSVPGASIRSGAAALALAPVSGRSLTTAALYPGLTIYGAYTATNTGDLPLALTVQALTGLDPASEFSDALVVAVGVVADSASCQTGYPATWTGTRASAAAGSLGTVLATGATAILCLSVALPVNVPDGMQGSPSQAFSITVGGTQT